MMRSILALLILPGRLWAAPPGAPASALGAKAAGREYVDMDVRRSFANAYDITEYRLDMRIHAAAFGSSLSFSGQPLSGSMYTSGTWWSIHGSQVSGNVSKGPDGFHVNATVYRPRGRALQLYFTLQANGRMDDPDSAPSFSLFGADASLAARPVFNGREYSVSGWLDTERFGAEGAALTALTLAAYMNGRRPNTRPLPSASWLEKSPAALPVLKNNGMIPLR